MTYWVVIIGLGVPVSEVLPAETVWRIASAKRGNLVYACPLGQEALSEHSDGGCTRALRLAWQRYVSLRKAGVFA